MMIDRLTLGFISGYSEFESYLITILASLLLLFWIFDIILITRRKKHRGKVRVFPFILSLIFLTTFFFFLFLVESKTLLRFNFVILNEITIAYSDSYIRLLHMSVLVPLILCTALLLFPSRTIIHTELKQDNDEAKEDGKKNQGFDVLRETTNLARQKAEIYKQATEQAKEENAQDLKKSKKRKGKDAPIMQDDTQQESDTNIVQQPIEDNQDTVADNSSSVEQESTWAEGKLNYFSKFDDEEPVEIMETKDVFKELGNNENDVKSYIDRTVKKLKYN